MKRLLIILAFLAVSASVATAGQPQFKDGKFKLIQFADTHIRTDLESEAKAVYDFMDKAIRKEKPDMIIMTGDNVTANPCEPEIRKLVKFLDSYRIPWCVVFGNHDDQQELSRAGMSAIYASGKYSLDRLNASGELADVEIPILGADGEPAFYLFCMDSNAYSEVLGKSTYDWFRNEQVNWLRECCIKRTVDGRAAPALAFFHIPLREYIDAWSSNENPREGTGNKPTVGIRGEKICCGGLNSGMFAAMKESGSVIGVSVGHDHDNDFVVPYYGIALCFGRFSGAGTVYNHLPRGARVFELREGEHEFETWIREDGGRVVRHTWFNGEVLKNAPRDRKVPYGSWSEIER